MSPLNFMELCRLCLVKDRVQIPIFEGEGDIRQIFLKIAACLPVKVKKDDKLPKKICDDCMYKVEMLYQFWNTTANAEKQLLEWLGEAQAQEDKKTASEPHVKQESLEQDNCSELAKSLSRVEAVLAETREVESDNDNFASGKAETDSDDEPLSSLEPTTFVNVGLDGSGTNESQSQGEFLAPGAPSTSKTTNATNSQNATSGFQDSTILDLNYDNVATAILQSGAVDPNSFPIERTKTKILKTKSRTCDFGQQTDMDEKTKKSKPRITRRTTKKKKEVENLIVEIFEKKLREKFGANDGNSFQVLKEEQFNAQIELPVQSNGIEESVDEELDGDQTKENIRDKKTKSQPGNGRRKTKTKKIITCEFCGKNFERNGNYLEHRRTHTGEKPFECGVCLMRFGSHAGLSRHKFVHQDSRTFVCDICNKIFKHQIQLKYHKETHTNTTPLNCDMCSYATLSKHYLNLHRATHLNRDRFVCAICSKGFNSRTYLLEHMNKHSGDKPFLCDICGKSYPARYSLAIHKQMKHDPNYKPRGRVPCQFCGKMILNRKQDLVRHRGIHTGEKPYVCHFCGKAVTNRESLKTHVRLHTGEKPFSCETCGTNFVSKNLLRVHKRTHTGEKPYCCNICDKSFTQRSSLVVHQRTHATDRPLECEQCNKVFLSVNNLNDHQKTHANNIFVYRVLS